MNRTVGSFEILQVFSDELCNALLSIVSPVFGGVEYIKRMHKEYLIKKELKVLSQKKDELILALTDVIPREASYEQYSKLDKKFKELQESPSFEKSLGKLNQLFESLSQRDQINIFLEIARKTEHFVSEMRMQASDRLIGASDTEDMIVLGQALRCVQILIEDIIESASRKPPNLRHTRFCLNFLLVFLVKFLTINVGKMNPQDLYGDIALCIYIRKPESADLGDDSAFAILGRGSG